jgi:hypothetical protein
LSKDEIDKMPLYLAFLCMGAVSEDKESLQLSPRDSADLQVAIAKRNKARQSG